MTILKAWFDTWAVFVKQDGVAAFRKVRCSDVNFAYTPNPAGDNLNESTPERPLTLESELNKLAANISIGRTMPIQGPARQL